MHWVYRLSDGRFTGAAISCTPPNPAFLAAHTPEGCALYQGQVDHERHQVVLVTDDHGNSVPTLQSVLPPRPADTPLATWHWDDAAQHWAHELTAAGHALNARAERDRRLLATDWSQGQDVPKALAKLWAEHRQALRDVPQQPGFPTQIEWPVPPD